MTVPEEGIGAVELKAKLGFDGAITATRWQHRVRQAMGTACLAAADYLGRDAEPEVMELKFAAAPPWLAAMRVVLVRPPPGCQGGPFLLRVPGTDTNTVHPAVIRELRSRWNSLTEQQRALRLPLRRDLPQSLDTLAQKLAAWLTDRAGLTQLPGDVQEYLDEFCFLYYDDEHAGADRVRDLFEPLLKTACLPPSENGPGASALPTPS